MKCQKCQEWEWQITSENFACPVCRMKERGFTTKKPNKAGIYLWTNALDLEPAVVQVIHCEHAQRNGNNNVFRAVFGEGFPLVEKVNGFWKRMPDETDLISAYNNGLETAKALICEIIDDNSILETLLCAIDSSKKHETYNF